MEIFTKRNQLVRVCSADGWGWWQIRSARTTHISNLLDANWEPKRGDVLIEVQDDGNLWGRPLLEEEYGGYFWGENVLMTDNDIEFNKYMSEYRRKR